jgi:hypothetical protein
MRQLLIALAPSMSLDAAERTLNVPSDCACASSSEKATTDVGALHDCRVLARLNKFRHHWCTSTGVKANQDALPFFMEHNSSSHHALCVIHKHIRLECK